MFNSRIFSKESSCDVSTRTAVSVSSCGFNAVNLLRVIGSKAGSLNDTATHEYVEIEKDSSITQSKKGKSILRPRHHLTGARKVCNGLVNHLLLFVDQGGKPLLSEDERNQMILFKPSCLFRFMVKQIGLEEKAQRGEVRCLDWGCSCRVHWWKRSIAMSILNQTD